MESQLNIKSQKFTGELQKMGFEIIKMKHALRINGCVDLWFNRRTVFIKPKNEYQNFDKERERIEFALNMAKELGKHEPFKKTDKGRMTYQEFKHKMRET